LGGINDFICVNCHLIDDNFKHDVRVALWNPTTDEFKVIPHSSARFQPLQMLVMMWLIFTQLVMLMDLAMILLQMIIR